MSFFFYDYETSGIDPKRDRILQFAGIRTDDDFNIIAEPICQYCQLSPTIIPNPQALLVTSITPERLKSEGLNEVEFISTIYKEFAKPNTCVAGYNNIRFDDEFTRYAFYRNFYDPYGREWQNNNSRWDLIDVVRMCAALRPEGVVWPQDAASNTISFKLENLTKANNLEHDKAHDALSDVYGTIALAKLIKNKQPKLFNYLLQARKKDFISNLLKINHIEDDNLDIKSQLFVHSSGMISNTYYATSIFLPLIKSPSNPNEIVMWDLRYDPTILLKLNSDLDYAKKLLYTSRELLGPNESRLQLKTIFCNKVPAVAPINTLDDACYDRLQLDSNLVLGRASLILANKKVWQDIILDLYSQKTEFENFDVEHELYNKFISNSDRLLCNQVVLNSDDKSNKKLKELENKFADRRLQELLFRYRARHYPDTLSAPEISKWREYCDARLNNTNNIAGIAKEDFIQQCINFIAHEDNNSSDKAVLQSWLNFVKQIN